MNLFFISHEILIILVGIFLTLFGLLAGFGAIVYLIDRRFSPGEKIRNRLIIISIILTVILLFCMVQYVPDYLIDGKIDNIYLVEKNGEYRLTVLFTRKGSHGMSTVYSHRIKTYDLKEGRLLGRLTLAKRYYIDDYAIFGPFNNNAWGYSVQTGISFLDLFKTSIIADENKIKKLNPVLGSNIQLFSVKKISNFDAVTFGIYVYSGNGAIYRIDPDLKAVLYNKSKNRAEHNKNKCAACRHNALFKGDIINTNTGWRQDKHIKNMLLFIGKNGKTLNKIDIIKMFGEKSNLYTTARVNNEVLLFITNGGYTLKTVRTDSETGAVLGQVKYF
jgi:hypothetical protein